MFSDFFEKSTRSAHRRIIKNGYRQFEKVQGIYSSLAGRTRGLVMVRKVSGHGYCLPNLVDIDNTPTGHESLDSV